MTMWTRALVTGASSGIGRACAELLASEGTHLVVVARSVERLDELAERLSGQHGVEVEVLPADLADRDAVERVAERLGADPSIDLCVNNAGFGFIGDFADLDVADELAEVDVNVRAVVRLTHAAITAMRPRGRGGVLNVSSIAGYQANPGGSLYAATKAFVTTFTHGVHEEERRHGLHVTALCPGLTRTEFQDRGGWEDADRVPGLLWQSAEDVARAGLDGVARGRANVIPGIQNHVLVGTSKVLPDTLVRKIQGFTARRR